MFLCFPVQVEPLVKSYLGNSLHLLSSMTQPDMTSYALRRLRSSVAFLGPYPRLTKKLLKLGLELFGSADQGPRLQASRALTGLSPLLDVVWL
jgi:nucleolar complex protein 2